MKKALEAGIKHCSLFEKYLTHLPEMVDFYYKQKIILQVMLAALDDEPEKPEPQESVEELAKFMHSVYEDKSKGVGWSTQESCRVDWDDLPVTNKIVMRYVAYNVMQLLKTKPAIDPEIKMVYEKLRHISILFSDEQWLKNDDGTISPIRQSIFDMWQAIKTHVGGNRGKQC